MTSSPDKNGPSLKSSGKICRGAALLVAAREVVEEMRKARAGRVPANRRRHRRQLLPHRTTTRFLSKASLNFSVCGAQLEKRKRRTPNAEHPMSNGETKSWRPLSARRVAAALCIKNWAFDVGSSAFSS